MSLGTTELIFLAVFLIVMILVGGAGIISRILSLPLYILFGVRPRADDSLPTLMVRQFHFNPNVQHGNDVVLELVARRRGWLVYQIMKLMGLQTEWKVRVTAQELRINRSAMNGSEVFVAPLSEITTSDLALEKPSKALWMGVIGLVAGLVIFLARVPTNSSFYTYSNLMPIEILGFSLNVPTFAPLIPVVFGLLCFAWYWWRSRLVMTFSTGDITDRYGLAFRPRRVGDEKVDQETLLASIHTINRMVVESRPAAEAAS